MSPTWSRRPRRWLLVDDNPGDVELTREAVSAARLPSELFVVTDGEEAVSFLRREGAYASAPRPDLVLLDLNLPRKDGREVLAEVKADPDLGQIPVVVLTTSGAAEDVTRVYQLHANGYLRKPPDFTGLLRVVRSLHAFWSLAVPPPAPE